MPGPREESWKKYTKSLEGRYGHGYQAGQVVGSAIGHLLQRGIESWEENKAAQRRAKLLSLVDPKYGDPEMAKALGAEGVADVFAAHLQNQGRAQQAREDRDLRESLARIGMEGEEQRFRLSESSEEARFRRGQEADEARFGRSEESAERRFGESQALTREALEAQYGPPDLRRKRFEADLDIAALQKLIETRKLDALTDRVKMDPEHLRDISADPLFVDIFGGTEMTRDEAVKAIEAISSLRLAENEAVRKDRLEQLETMRVEIERSREAREQRNDFFEQLMNTGLFDEMEEMLRGGSGGSMPRPGGKPQSPAPYRPGAGAPGAAGGRGLSQEEVDKILNEAGFGAPRTGSR